MMTPDQIEPVLTRMPSRDRVVNGRDFAAYLLSDAPDVEWQRAFNSAWSEASPAVNTEFELLCENPRLDGPSHGVLLMDITGLLDMVHTASGFPAPVYLKRLAETCVARVNTAAAQRTATERAAADTERAAAEKRLARLNAA